jgi:hypothetical protein
MSVSTHSIYTNISLSNMTFYNMKQLLIFLTILIVVSLFIYHTDLLDTPEPTAYTCQKIEGLLMGGWHPDIPASTIQQCRKLKQQLQEKYHATTT